MKTVTIDCAGIENARQLHEALARAMKFPEWYGRNLDALFDCLTETAEPTCLRLEGWRELGTWKSGFGAAFADAGLENPELDIVLR